MPTTAEKILRWSAGRLSRSGIESPRLESELLLADAIGGTRLNVQLNPHRPLTEEERSRFHCSVDRRTAREPMAYILGRREFWSLDFKITPGSWCRGRRPN